MSDRFKIIGLVFITFSVVVGLTYLATVTLVQTQYAKIEAKDVQQNTGRAVDAASNRVDQLAIKASDWSSWDDTYDFIVDHNNEYQVSNLQNESLGNLDINFMLFFDANQKLVTAKGVDVETSEDLVIPAELLAALKPGSKLLATSPDSDQRGFIKTSKGAVAMVAQPILTSAGDGPLRGTLVFAQYLSKAEVDKLASLTHLSLSYYLLGQDMPGDVAAARDHATATTGVVTALSDSRIAGYRLVNDIYGKPFMIARVELARDAFQEAGRTLNFYLLVILVVALIAIVVAIYTTNQIVRRDRTIQLKNEFFSIASHELRTPLAAIRGNSELITAYYGPKNDPKLTDLSNDIHAASVRLVKLVTNFLDAARLESGRMPMTQVPVHLHDPVEAVAKELGALADQNKLYIKTEVATDLPMALGDIERIQEVIYNLVGNAMKFTDKGGVTIAAEQRGNQIVILVRDTGRGMTAEQKRVLFKKFEQTRVSDAAVGTGLGLYISKLMVERMGGRMWLESSEEGQGTTFGFGLPIAKQ